MESLGWKATIQVLIARKVSDVGQGATGQSMWPSLVNIILPLSKNRRAMIITYSTSNIKSHQI